MRAVNLLPRDAPRQSFGGQSTRVAVGGTIGFVLVSVLLAASILSAGGAVKEKRDTLEGVRAALAALPQPSAVESADTTQLESEKAQRISALAGALAGRTAFDRVLRGVSLILPDDVWLTSLSATSPAVGAATAAPPASGSAAPSGFLLSGATYSQAAVARLLSRLAVVPDLERVTLQSAATAKVGEKEVVQFTIVANVKAPEVAS
jgi:Tfp pilus assembly protein PilN